MDHSLAHTPIFQLLVDDFKVLCPTRATRCTGDDEIWCGGLDSTTPNFDSIGAGVELDPRTENVTKFWSINATQGRVPSTIF